MSRPKFLMILGITVALFVTACATSSEPEPSSTQLVADTIAIPTSDIKWVDEPWGGKTALVWGDPKTGPSGYFIYHPPGFKMPPNVTITHTANMRAVILSGWMKVWQDGNNEADVARLEAGSFFLKPGGVPHFEAHSADEATTVYVTYDQPRDTFLNGELMPTVD